MNAIPSYKKSRLWKNPEKNQVLILSLTYETGSSRCKMVGFFSKFSKTLKILLFSQNSLNVWKYRVGFLHDFFFVQEALSHVEANMTSGSLANLSHVSDVLTEHY
jgi:hypothetical protein